uniref:Uncharacterized protein n=1 Tax=Tetradesmus obliquus TaxID=3088 RepID=A0A383V7H6_TETOB
MAAKHYTAVGLLLALFLSSSSAALLLKRPDADCIAPAVSSLQYNFYPKSYQLTSIQPSSTSSSSGFTTTVEFAQDFTVTYRGTFKIVSNKRANETYVLYQCGTPNPMDSADTEMGLDANTKVFQIPLSSVAVADSSAAGFLAELGLIDRVAFSSKFSYNTCLQAIFACGQEAVSASAPFDYDPSPENDAEFNASLAEWRQESAAQGSQVDAIFTSSASSNPKSIAVTSFADPGVLKRAEWVKFVAVFFNKEVEAETLFSSITTDYQKLNASARAAAGADAKTVAWLTQFGDTLTLNYAQYKTEYMEDAGGRLIPSADLLAAGAKLEEGLYSTVKYNFNASVPAQKTGFINVLKTVDIIFDDTYSANSSHLLDLAAFKTAYGLSDAQAADIPAIAAGQVWTFNKRLGARNADGSVGSDWFESSVARPDLVLGDFVKVITPAAAAANAQLNWLRQLSDSQVLSFSGPADCADVKTAANAADRCSRAQPARICPNAYRDCATGELRTVTDPSQRCEAQTVCPDATNANTTATPKNAAARPAAFAFGQLLTALLGMAMLALML